VALPAVIGLAVTGALVLACFIKAFGLVFLGAPRTQSARHAHECGPRMRGSMMILATACVTIGLIPVILWPWLANATTAWNPAWGPGDPPAPLATLGFVFTGFALIPAIAAWLLFLRARSNGLALTLTWDCGYAEPTSRMQYSAGSFSEITSGWFRSILRPELRLRRPRGPFPVRADRMERTPEAVLERVIEPAGRLVMMSARGMRQLQHGRLQAYIL
jgi:hydrogenase-4 component B